MYFTWRRLTGATLIAVPAFFAVCGIIYVLEQASRFRQDFLVSMGVAVMLGVVFPAWAYGEETFRWCAATVRCVPGWVRIPVAAFACWAAAVLLFVWTFEPFGRYIDDREWGMVVKIVVFPLLLAAVAAGLYRLVKK